MLDLRSARPTLSVSTASIEIVPSVPVNLKMDAMMEDFPAPVRPTIPIWKEKASV